ncbi:Abi family protein [Virgibacillus sp. DJP39]|uniref:Abi family protein n=1 Tax=Virgibacillus sp. DJP39 TaxID=3409790 RepID=UPI003BB6051C
MESKPFKSVNEQIDILIDRGLTVDDRSYAYSVLSHVNYYRLSGYTLTLRKNDEFYKNVTLEQVMQIYNFDAELRSLLLYFLENIEVSFRAHLGYFHSEKYGPLGYMDKDNFVDARHYDIFYQEIKRIKDDERNEVFIKHHNENYNKQFPFWVVVELMSFGCLSRGFKNLHEDIKVHICKEHYSPIPYYYIENWLQGFVILRNICAHRGRLYNRYITYVPKLSPKDKKLFKRYNLDLNKETKQIFTYIYVMNKLIGDEVIMDSFIYKFKELIVKYPFVKLSHYGFPDDWEKLLNYK